MEPPKQTPGSSDRTRSASEPDRPLRPSRRRVGPYHILEPIGEGGFGEVYAAEQVEPVQRRVAIKFIKAGMDTKAVLARFEAERQALAMMDHPNIAKVFDAGETDQGRPYFVMELVRGEPLTDYCDRHCLNTRQRLELFIPVCHAIQHAHQKGVIHRDIKPSNILVSIVDGGPVSKVIDFGVAKATGKALTEKTLYTQQGQLIGTPKYMSPEQAEMGALDVDTRTDVYSLGAVLYEVLTGGAPFSTEMLRRAGLSEIQRILREEDPPRPSTRISTMAERQSDVARQHGSDVRALARQVSGDLDWITMKALAKDRTHRYGTPVELAQDIMRHLRQEPVAARPPSTVYRMRKFYQRHRTGVLASSVVLVALAIGLAGTTVGFIRAKEAERRAIEEVAVSEQVVEFLVGVFDVSNPFSEHYDREDVSDEVTARELLDRAAARIETDLAGQKAVQARLMEVMGQVYTELGAFDQAAPLVEGAVAKHAEVRGDRHSATADALVTQAHLRIHLEEFAEAESLASLAYSVLKESSDGEPGDLARASDNLFRALLGQRDFERATELVVDGLESTGEAGDSITYFHAWGQILVEENRPAEAEEKYEQAYDLARTNLDPDDPSLATYELTLGFSYARRGEHQKAEPLLTRALERVEEIPGRRGDRAIGNAWHVLAVLRQEQGRYSEAADALRESIKAFEEMGEPGKPSLPNTLNSLSIVYRHLGRGDEAEAAARRSVEIMREFGWDSPVFMKNLAAACSMTGKREEATELFQYALETQEQSDNPDNGGMVWLLDDYAKHCLAYGENAKAARLGARGVVLAEEVYGPEHPDLARCLDVLGRAEAARGRQEEGEAALSRAFEMREKLLGPEHPKTVETAEALAELYRNTGRRAQAEELEARLVMGG